MSTAAIAANLYSANAGIGRQSMPTPGAEEIAGPNFANLVTEAVNDVTALGRTAEATQVDMLQGKSNLVDVVTAVAETEVALQTVVSTRDRVISAYEEIMRMPI